MRGAGRRTLIANGIGSEQDAQTVADHINAVIAR